MAIAEGGEVGASGYADQFGGRVVEAAFGPGGGSLTQRGGAADRGGAKDGGVHIDGVAKGGDVVGDREVHRGGSGETPGSVVGTVLMKKMN